MTQPNPPLPAAPPAPDPNTSVTEPLITVGAIVTLVTVVLDAVVLFGVHLSDAQTSGVLAVVNVAAPLVVAAWGRRRVYSPATVARLLAVRR